MSSSHDEPEDMETDDAGQHQAAPGLYPDLKGLETTGSGVDTPPAVVSSQPQPLSANPVSGGGRMEENPGWNLSGGERMEVNPGWNHASDGPASLTSMTYPNYHISYPPTFPTTSVNLESQPDRPPQSPGPMPAASNVSQTERLHLRLRMDVNAGGNHASDNGPLSPSYPTSPPTSVNSESQTERPPQSPGPMPAAFNVTGGGRMEINPGLNHGSDIGPTSPSYPPTSPPNSVNSESQSDRPPQSRGIMTAASNVSQTGKFRMDVNAGLNHASDNGPLSPSYPTSPPTSVNSESQTERPPQSPGTMPAAVNVPQSGGERMEINPGGNHRSDNRPTSTTSPPTSPTSVNPESQTDRPPQSHGTMPAASNVGEGAGGVRCLAYVLGWPQDEKPLQKRQLQKALQSWFNRNEMMSDTSCSIQSLSVDGRAEVTIQPASALERHLMSQDIPLPVIDKKTATVRFLSAADAQTPTPVSHSADVHSPVLPSAAQHVKTHKEAQSTAAEPRRQETTPPPRGQDTEAKGQETKVRGQETAVSAPSPQRGQEVSVPFPLSPFVYLNQAYREEMKRIERDNGVTIMAEVKVSFEVDRKNNNNGGSPNPERALDEFVTLAQKCSGNLDSVTIPSDQEDFRRVLQKILREESRLVLSASCREMSVSGPFKSVADVRQSLQTPQSTTSTNGGFSAAASPQKIGMVKKDPSVSGGLLMHQSHWTAMTMTFDRALANIKTKYSVSLQPEFSRDEVTVRVKAAGGGISSTVAANSLESHAFRALLRLYQKVVTSSTMGFSPQPSDQKAQKVADKIQQDMSARHPGVGVRDDHGYLGLPQPSARTAAVAGGATAAGETKEDCQICCETRPQMEKLACGHELCKDCKMRLEGPVCPWCKDVFGKMEGDQPPGTMSCGYASFSLPGFRHCGTITIDYNIPGGTQTKKHPNPGKHYYGTQRTAYLPDNTEGREVVKLLKKAFDQKLIFTVGTSRTTGSEDQVTWNDIHHKTNISGGPQGFGYPDDKYLSRVRDELKDKGIN